MTTKLNQQEHELWTVIIWALWNARNKYHFKKTQLQSQHIYEGALGLLTDYQHLMTAQTTWALCVSLLYLTVAYFSQFVGPTLLNTEMCFTLFRGPLLHFVTQLIVFLLS